MGWLSAGTGTLIVAYLIYVATVRLVARQTEAKQAVKADAVRDSGPSIERMVPSTAEQPNARPAAGGPAPPPRTPPATPAQAQAQAPAQAPPTIQLAEDAPVPTLMAPPPLQQPPLTQPKPPPSLLPPPPPPSVRSSPPRLKPPTMSAPPRPANASLRPPPSSAASLRVPQTKVLSNTHMQPASSTLGVPKKRSRQVTLGPGYSPLNWAALTSNPNSGLRGKDAPPHLARVTPSRLRKQTGRKGKDAWTVYQGRVYNITPYLPFHPGGVAELMRGAGRDAGALFMEVHPWVNWDGMLSECLVGILVAEDDAEAETNTLDEMD